MSKVLKLIAIAGLIAVAPAGAQVSNIDPNDVGEYEPAAQAPTNQWRTAPADSGTSDDEWETVPPATEYAPIGTPAPAYPAPPPAAAPGTGMDAERRASQGVSKTVAESDVLAAAEGVFGRGAQGLAGLIEGILAKQGHPDGYITGSEAGGALVVGLRYGKGTLYHEGGTDLPVYWTGPSVGFDFGGDANKVFVLVYNLQSPDQLFAAKRFGAAEGNAYVVGGFKASYLRHGDTVLIPIRTGVGVRLGVNAGYMKFTKKGTWLPF